MLRQTSLHGRHEAAGARMVEFGGWSMPVQYQGIVAEHRACRTAAGLFDVSHMGEFDVSGPGAAAFLEQALTNRVADLSVGRCRYALLCAPDGGVLDDLLVYRLGEAAFRLVVNAANIGGDWTWLQGLPREDAELVDQSDGTGLIAVQGPRSPAVLADLLDADAAARLSALRYYQFGHFELAGAPAVISRTGYTGDRGYEVFVPAAQTGSVWDALVSAGEPHGLALVGLGARDTLRLEAGFCLHGHELSPAIDPLSAGLERFVALDKPFVGRDALVAVSASGPARRLIGLEVVGRQVIREGCRIEVDGRAVGQVTSGTFAPSLDRSVGLGYVRAELARPGGEVTVSVRERPVPCRLVQPPFYRPAQAG